VENDGVLSGRVVLLTGADGCAGAVTKGLLAQGARVAVVGAGADPVVGPGSPVLALSCGPDNPADLSRAVDTVIRRLGRLDHLVNLVAVRPRTDPLTGTDPLMELDPLALRDVLRRDLVAPLAWIQRAYWRWMAEHGGSVVNVVTDVVRGGPQHAALAALTELTEWLAAELAPRVDVHTVVPSPSLDAATYQAGITDALSGLLTHPRCPQGPGGPARDLVQGPVLVLTPQPVRPRRAA